jgi:hypothetical protein
VSAAGLLGNGVRLRRRLTALPVLGERVPGVARDPRAADADVDDDHVVVHVDGLDLSEATRAAAVAHLRATGLQALDLVPGDLPVEELLDHLRIADPVRLRENPIFLAFGAGQAVVMTRRLAERAEIVGGAADTVDVRRAFTQAKRYAPHGVDQVVAPGLVSVPLRDDQNLSVWRTQYGRPLPIVASTRLGPALGAAVAAVGGAAAAAAVAAATAVQPAVVTLGTAARPRDRRSWRAGVGRVAAIPVRLARSARGGGRPARPPPTHPRFNASARARVDAADPPTSPAASTGSSASGGRTARCAAAGPSASACGRPT